MMRETRMTPPANLALALRVHASRRSRPDLLGRMRVRLENMMEPFAVPAMAEWEAGARREASGSA